jgi:hypothetical protein
MGELKWEPTSGESTFQTSFPKYSVSITHVAGDYLIRLFNESGRHIESVSSSELYSGGFEKAGELFELARRNALQVDNALDELVGELSKIRTRK